MTAVIYMYISRTDCMTVLLSRRPYYGGTAAGLGPLLTAKSLWLVPTSGNPSDRSAVGDSESGGRFGSCTAFVTDTSRLAVWHAFGPGCAFTGLLLFGSLGPAETLGNEGSRRPEPPPPPAVPQLTPVGVDWPEQAERRAPASQPHVERPCSRSRPGDQETGEIYV